MRTPSRRTTRLAIWITTATAVGLWTQPSSTAKAQSGQQLPPVVIEGATLAVKPARARPATGADTPSITTSGAGTAVDSSLSNSGGAGGAGESGTNIGTQIDQTGSAITVVTGAQLKAQQVRHAADALRSLPGVAVSRTGGFAGVTQVRMRGAEGNHTLVVIDGIEANSANNGEFDFANLSVEDIERIEVIRGPQSGIYGSNAVGGVINIVTRGGRGPLTVSVKAEAGSFNTQDGALRISGGNDKAYFSGSLHQRKTSGFEIAPNGAENDGSQLSNVSLKAGAEIVRDVDLDLTLRSQRTRGKRDTEGVELGKLQEQVDAPTTFTNADMLLGARLRWSMMGGGLIHELRASQASNVITDDAPDFKARNESETSKYAYKATASFATPGVSAIKHSVTGQIETRNDNFRPLSDFADGIERERGQRSFAGEWTGAIYDRLFLTAGARRDDNDTFQDFTTWRTSASLKLTEIGLRPHASLGTGVKVPTMYELFGSIPAFFTPNPNLTPEFSRGWDAGVELALWQRRVVLDVTYFKSELTDKIDGFATDTLTGNFTAVNLAGASRRDGIETEATWQVLPGVTLRGAHTWLDATSPTGLREVRRPQHAARVDVAWQFDSGRGLLNLGAVYNGSQDDNVRRVTAINCFPPFGCFPTLQPERFKLSDYTVVSLAAAYKLTPQVELFGRIENVLDTKYQEIYGFETAGIAAFAGLRLTFEDPSTTNWRQSR
jgi:vitamin B12 transporter